jgi:hypothetical protein
MTTNGGKTIPHAPSSGQARRHRQQSLHIPIANLTKIAAHVILADAATPL